MYDDEELNALLNLLKTQSPEMYEALTTPYDTPGEFIDGDMPLDATYGEGKIFKRFMNSGYDPNLIMENAKQNMAQNPFSAGTYPDLQSNVIMALRNADPNSFAMESSRLFPSDEAIVYTGMDKIDNPEFTANALSKLDANGLNKLYLENSNRPALTSVFSMLLNNPNIGK